ncbi:hypothetical protein [Alkalimarinus sediminis]|uniref:Uncharacterized protein n=1 Tax=Alkalimarinus sediminis TaxID=1632866 RepID=A0A9E8HTP2_9ALTE|nr:hypothetical protein [Alkalimarinus sediminis]UZW75554.1 hypothetical protein NNL22_02880 [Alkalimarinus sediminis]
MDSRLRGNDGVGWMLAIGLDMDSRLRGSDCVEWGVGHGGWVWIPACAGTTVSDGCWLWGSLRFSFSCGGSS